MFCELICNIYWRRFSGEIECLGVYDLEIKECRRIRERSGCGCWCVREIDDLILLNFKVYFDLKGRVISLS